MPKFVMTRGARRHAHVKTWVGVNMVLAESVKFKHGLYRSCSKECFEGIVLEPCLLQPCFHVAGKACARRCPSLATFGSFPNTIGFLDPLRPTRLKPDCVWKGTESSEKSFPPFARTYVPVW